MISRENAPALRRRDMCDGWTLVESDDLHVVEERVSLGTNERPHLHERVRQLDSVLGGLATIDLEVRSQ